MRRILSGGIAYPHFVQTIFERRHNFAQTDFLLPGHLRPWCVTVLAILHSERRF